MRIPAFQQARPLVFRIAAMGDAVLLVPMLQALHQRFGQPCDVISSGPWTEPVLSSSPHAAEIRILSSRRTPYWLNRSQQRLVAWLRHRPPGPVYLCESDHKTAVLLRYGGVRREWLCTARDIPQRYPEEHQIDHELRLARQTPRALGGVALDELPGPTPDHSLQPTPEAVLECDAWLRSKQLESRPFVLLQPGNKRTMRRGSRLRASNSKYWPEENWIQIARGIRRHRPGHAVLVCGSPHEFALAEEIVRGCSDASVLNVANELPIPRLMAALARAHSMISIDTGPAHLASAIGCPLTVLFPRDTDFRYFTRATTAPVRIVTPPPVGSENDEAHPLVRLHADTVLNTWQMLADEIDGSTQPAPGALRIRPASHTLRKNA